MFIRITVVAALLAGTIAGAGAQEVKRRIISRHDLTGTNMEMILVETEVPPGATSPRHTHPGEEAFYVLQGAKTELPGKAAVTRETGTGGINVRDVPHAGYKVVDDHALKMVNVYVVDKGKPLASPAN